MLPKYIHEMRDPIHVFIRLNSDERLVVDSEPFQRLRHIHQLAMSYLVYPGATHMRFEHALGTMELASKVFDVVTDPRNVHPRIRSLIPELSSPPEVLGYWRGVVRMAALCHDLGHLPFSHAAEKDLLPEGWDHERITVGIIKGDAMREIWETMTPPLRADEIAKIAVGQKVLQTESFTDWETILSEIIVGDAFGVDRIDYLLRDSHHTGVGYGKFDHHRLLDTMMILPSAAPDASNVPALGIDKGGLHSAEALLLARYFMYTQVYCHQVRRIYDIHLIEFMRVWLNELHSGTFPTAPEEILKCNDIDILKAMLEANRDECAPGHESANRILGRNHYRLVYEKSLSDVSKNPEPGKAVCRGLSEQYPGKVVRDLYKGKSSSVDFPVLEQGEEITSSVVLSDVINKIPEVALDNVYVAPECVDMAKQWLASNKDDILKVTETEAEEG